MALSDRLRENARGHRGKVARRCAGHLPRGRRATPSAASRTPLPIRWAMPCAWGRVPLWRALSKGRTRAKSVAALDEIIKIRAVQEFTPSQALAFVFLLKEAVRAELGSEEDRAPALPAELADLDRQIDQVALGAFDAYMRYRGQVCELRINEVKTKRRRDRGEVEPSRSVRRNADEEPVADGERRDVRRAAQRGGGR